VTVDVRVVDPAILVQGEMSVYECADIASVDKHIRQVGKTMRRIMESGKYSELPPKYRADIDLLLERRLWLAVLLEEAPA
jgi:hypothetical protein